MTSWLVSLGFTRDSVSLVWTRVVTACVLIVAGFVPLDDYFSPTWVKWLKAAAVGLLFLSGHLGNSPLPSRAEMAIGLTHSPESTPPSQMTLETTKPIEVTQKPPSDPIAPPKP